MRIAETVTFGGSALDRAAEIRGDAAALAAAAGDPRARCVLLWRGKPLIDHGPGAGLVRLAMDHPVLAGRDAAPTLLGREAAGAPVFAHDFSDWSPAALPDTLDAFADPSRQHHPALPDTQLFTELRACMNMLGPRDAELAATARALFGWHRSHRFCARCGVESTVTMAGWQRLCPACGGHHFPRTDPVVIMLITHGNDVLLGRSPGWPAGMFSLLAGFVEPGETMEAAVRREVREETGVAVAEVGYLASQPWPFPASLMLGCHGRATSRDITIDPVEIEDALWIGRDRLAGIFAGEDTSILPARRGAIAHFLLRNWLADRLD